MRPRPLLGALLAVTALTAGCSAESGTSGSGPSSGGSSAAAPGGTSSGTSSASSGSTSSSVAANALAGCTPSALKTFRSGQLTVATDSPAYDPWFSNNKPSNGKGFESAVSYAVAQRLGFSRSQVHWTVAPFNSVIAPTPKQWDFDANEFSITAQRAKAVDFSSPYYDVTQAVVTLKGDKYAGATSVAQLKGARFGAQRDTTSYDAITQQIKPSSTPLAYPTNDLAVQALKNGTIDALVVDLPTGFYVTSAQLDNAKIVGQLPQSGKPEQFGLVLSKGSSLTRCVSAAVDALRSDGTLTRLEDTWLAGAGAPKLS